VSGLDNRETSTQTNILLSSFEESGIINIDGSTEHSSSNDIILKAFKTPLSHLLNPYLSVFVVRTSIL